VVRVGYGVEAGEYKVGRQAPGNSGIGLGRSSRRRHRAGHEGGILSRFPRLFFEGRYAVLCPDEFLVWPDGDEATSHS
jgi:hypothetical protein